MPRQCVFYLRGYREHCEVARALGQGSLGKDRSERLQHTYCSTTRFRDCPMFKAMERNLASTEGRPELQPVAA